MVEGLTPEILSVNCSDNPATTSHDVYRDSQFQDSSVDVVIEVFDMGGRLLWQHQTNGASSGNAFTHEWNLTLDDGSRLSTGVYLYRVRLSADGSSETTKAKKLIVINNN